MRWQATQVIGGRGRSLRAPWHEAQVTAAWRPTSGKRVRPWSNRAPFHDSGEWQLAQSRPLAPLWTSSFEVAGDALARRAGKAAADVAGGALRLLVRADQAEIPSPYGRSARIDLPPRVAVAAGAIAAEAALVLVVLGVAGDAGERRGAERRGGHVAAAALQAAMLAADREIALLVIELGLAQVDQVLLPSAMLGVAGAALRAAHLVGAAVETGLLAHVARDALMARHALGPFGERGEGEVAGRAARLELGVAARQGPGADQPLDRRPQQGEACRPRRAAPRARR